MITKEMLEAEFYDAREAAIKLNVNVHRISVLASQGRFEGAFKIWQGWLIPKSSVDNFQRKPRGFPKGTHTHADKARQEISTWLARAGYTSSEKDTSGACGAVD